MPEPTDAVTLLRLLPVAVAPTIALAMWDQIEGYVVAIAGVLGSCIVVLFSMTVKLQREHAKELREQHEKMLDLTMRVGRLEGTHDMAKQTLDVVYKAVAGQPLDAPGS